MATSETVRVDETDSLANLEERIVRAVQLVTQLRQDKESGEKQLLDAMAENEMHEARNNELQTENARLNEELEAMRAERKQVRGRIEKLLGQLDLLSAG